MHVEAGSSVVLKCSVTDWMSKPTFIFWYQDDERLVADGHGISIDDNVNTGKSSIQAGWQHQEGTALYSILTIKEASSRYSGRYSCVPDNLRPDSINVHVILGKSKSNGNFGKSISFHFR